MPRRSSTASLWSSLEHLWLLLKPVSSADDFTIGAGDAWILNGLVWRSYQTGGTTAGTLNGINVNLWDDDPLNGGSAAQSGPANSFVSQVWSGAEKLHAGTVVAQCSRVAVQMRKPPGRLVHVQVASLPPVTAMLRSSVPLQS